MGNDLSTPEGIMENLRLYVAELTKWSSKVYGKIPKKNQAKRNALNSITKQDKGGDMSTEINSLRKEINKLLDDEESIGGKELKLIGLRRRTRILSSSMLKLLKGVSKIQFWEFGMSKVDGVMKRKALPK